MDGRRFTSVSTPWKQSRPESPPRPRDSSRGRGCVGVRVLVGTKCVEGNPKVVTGTGEGAHLTDLQKPWRWVRKAKGLEDVRIHDLRISFASEAVMGGESLPMVGRTLGDTQPQTTLQRASAHTASSLKKSIDRSFSIDHDKSTRLQFEYC